jgi:hypothetical protein
MRRATRIVAATFGAFAGIGGLEHGYFEILQGNGRPNGVMIASMGPPCVPEEAWHACEPAMTVLPSFLVTGILAMGLGLVALIWSAGFVDRRLGGTVLLALSTLLLLFGGGIFPPVIGLVGGLVGLKIHAPPRQAKSALGHTVLRFLGRLWPWPLVVFFVGLFSQWILGYLFIEFWQSYGVAFLGLIMAMMPLSILAAWGHDVQR